MPTVTAPKKQPSKGQDYGSDRDNFGAGKSRAQRVISLFNSMESDALNFRTRWQECANYIQPRKGNILTLLSPGQPQTILLWDTTAEQSLITYAAGLVSFLTPPSERWFRLEPQDDNAPQEFRDWLNDCSERMAQEIGNSNFYEVWHEDCLDGGCFGSSLMRTDEYASDRDNILGFTNIPVGNFYWKEDNRGRISTIARKWKWSCDQAEEEFGEDALTPQLVRCFRSAEPSDHARQFNFIELIRPRRKADVKHGPTIPENRPWECLYVCIEDNDIVREDGYYENPYAGCRLMRSNNESYGRGPGTQAMPEIKMVNRMEEDMAVVIERMARPSWIMPDDTAYDPDNRPDGVTYWEAAMGAAYKPEQIEMKNRVDLGETKTQQKRKVIQDYFFVDMFKLLTREEVMEQQKTAFEVQQMVNERMILFSPIFGRITKEKLNPTLFRVFAIMFRNGRFKPMPAGLDPRSLEFQVSYVSKIALAIKAVQNEALATAVQIITSMMQLDPSVVYLLKCPEAARQVLVNAGVPSAWLRSEYEVKQMSAQQQAAAQRLQSAQAAMAGSQAIKNLGPTAQGGATQALSQAASTPAAIPRLSGKAA
jgi:hypothetical protein